MHRRLLFADHDSELYAVYQRYFTAAGFEVSTAADGLECLTQIERFPPGVLVVMKELPRGGAETVLARLGEADPLRTIDVIMIADDPEGVEVQPPVIACLQKPFRLKTLLAVLQSRPKQRCLAPTSP
jgi:DNA-binding response OmpR family regulator